MPRLAERGAGPVRLLAQLSRRWQGCGARARPAVRRDLRAHPAQPRPRGLETSAGGRETPVTSHGRRSRSGVRSGRSCCGRSRRCGRGLRNGPRRSSRRRRGVVVARGRRQRRALLGIGQQRERVHVALALGRSPHAEMHRRARRLRHTARAHRAHYVPLEDGLPASHRVRPEVYERNRVAVGGLDGDRLSLRGNGSGEGDRARDGRDDVGSHRRSDVDAAMLPRLVRVARVEGEERQHGPRDRPAPAQRGRREGQGDDRNHRNEQTHPQDDLRCQSCKPRHRSKVERSLSNVITAMPGTGGCAERP